MSRLVLGTMIVTAEKQERSSKLLDDAFEKGYTTLDTAHIYAGGNSERAIGVWMEERGNREEIVVIGKGAHPNADRKRITPHDIASDLHDSLTRLRSDCIDLYMLHRDDPEVPVGEIVEWLNAHVEAGNIRAFGGSNWTHERLAEANRYAEENDLVPFSASSPHFSLAEQVNDPWGENSGSVGISGPAGSEARAWYQAEQMPVFAWSSLGRGFFSGRLTRENCAEVADGACLRAYCREQNFRRLDRVRELAEKKGVTVPQLALAYVMRQQMNMFALVGAANREELEANDEALDLELTADELSWLDLETD